ncbi:Protein NUT, partial [Ophiophagus hannah]
MNLNHGTQYFIVTYSSLQMKRIMASQNHTQGPGLSPCPPNVPSLLLSAFPGAALLVTSADTPGSKLIIKLKREGPLMGGSEELPRTQTFFLTGMPLGWATQRRDGPGGPGIRTVLLTKAGEEPGGRKTRAPEAIPSAQGSPSSDTSFACTSKGVYENYRRWQRYKALARRHFPATPDAEALACFFIPVLRSLARLRPNMTLEDGVPRAVQEWEHSSNFERMIFYEMAEKFMEFEAEEEQQIQKMKLLATCSQFQNPKSASKSRQPRRRQRRPPSTSNPGAPREIPAEAVHQYAEIMEGLNPSWEEEEAEKKEHGMCRDAQDQEEMVFPDPGLLQYIDQLCDNEEFVCKVEAVIHPQFMVDLLSPEKTQDPLDLVEELAEELNLTPSQTELGTEIEFPRSVQTELGTEIELPRSVQTELGTEIEFPRSGQTELGTEIELPRSVQTELGTEIELSRSVQTELGTEIEFPRSVQTELDPSVYPTSHSDSTPSQSEEEDEVSGNGKGEDMLQQALKRPSTNKGIRASQLELATSIISSPPISNAQQKLGDREFLPKTIRASLSPHEYYGHDSQEGNLLSTLKNPEERDMQKFQEKDLTMNNSNETPTQWAFPSIKGNSTLSSHLASLRDSKTRPEIVRLVSSGHSKQGIIQEQKKKDQVESSKTTDKGSYGVIAPVKNGIQIIWNNIKPTQDNNQKGQVKTVWAAQGSPSKQAEPNKQDNMMLAGNRKWEKHLTLSFGGCKELNEQVINPPQSQEDMGFESLISKAELNYQERKVRSYQDTQRKVNGQEVIQFERDKQESCQGAIGQDQFQIQGLQKSNVTSVQFENVNPCGRSIASQDRVTPALSGIGHKLVSQGAKIPSQRKSHTNVKQMKTVSIKNKIQARSIRFPVDNLALHKQSSWVRQEGQPSTELAVLETHQETSLKASVELGRKNMQPFCSGGSSEGGKLENQLPDGDSEHLPYFTFSGHEPPSLIVQSGLEKLQESQGAFSDQDKVTPQAEKLSNDESLKPTLDPSSYISMSKADGENSGPHGDPNPVPTSVFPPPLSFQGNSSHGNTEFNPTLLSSESKVYWEPVIPEKETSNWNQSVKKLPLSSYVHLELNLGEL